VFYEVWELNVSNSKSNLQGHSRALAMVPLDRPQTILLLVFHCNYVSILHCWRDVITCFPNLKRSRDTSHILSGAVYDACTSTPMYQSAHKIWSA